MGHDVDSHVSGSPWRIPGHGLDFVKGGDEERI
jgi:hypothetical protein